MSILFLFVTHFLYFVRFRRSLVNITTFQYFRAFGVGSFKLPYDLCRSASFVSEYVSFVIG